MTDSAVSAGATEACFDLRSAMLTLTVLELHYFEENAFEASIRDKIRQAPGFFKDLPLVIGLDRYQGKAADLDFFQIIGCCRRHSIQVVAVKGGDEDMRRLARNAALACLPSEGGSRGTTRKENTESGEAKEAASATTGNDDASATTQESDESRESGENRAARVVTQPVRSGQQVYAPEGDLIIMAPVGAGAEVLAAGHIHIYGPLRGRALAGVLGDSNANVFCQSLEAELVSIAGQYKISEDLQDSCWREPARIRLRDDLLTVDPLGRG